MIYPIKFNKVVGFISGNAFGRFYSTDLTALISGVTKLNVKGSHDLLKLLFINFSNFKLFSNRIFQYNYLMYYFSMIQLI